MVTRRDFLFGNFGQDNGQENQENESDHLKQRIAKIENKHSIVVVVDYNNEQICNWLENFLDELELFLQNYSPSFFVNLAELRHNVLDIDTNNPEPIKKLTFIPEIYNKDNPSGGSANFDELKISIRLSAYRNYQNTLHHEVGHILHYAFGKLQFTTYNPNEVFFNSVLGSENYSDKNQSTRHTVCATKYPGFVQPYSLTNDRENFSMTYEEIMSNPKGALNNFYLNKSAENSMKFLAIIHMLEIISGGTMGKQYLRDLAHGKVNDEYWKQKPEINFYHFDTGEYSVFTADLSVLPEVYYPASVSIHITTAEKDELDQRAESGKSVSVPMKNFKSSIFVLDNERDKVYLEVDGVPFPFLSLSPGKKAQITIYTVDTQTNLTIIRDSKDSIKVTNFEEKKLGVQEKIEEEKNIYSMLFLLAASASGAESLHDVIQKTRNSAKRNPGDLEENSVKKKKESSNDLLTRRAFLKYALLISSFLLGSRYKLLRTSLDRTQASGIQDWYENRQDGWFYKCQPIGNIDEAGWAHLLDVDNQLLEDRIATENIVLSENNSLENLSYDKESSKLRFSFHGIFYEYLPEKGCCVPAEEVFADNYSSIIIIDNKSISNISYVCTYIADTHKEPRNISLYPDVTQNHIDSRTVNLGDDQASRRVQITNIELLPEQNKTYFQFEHFSEESGSFEIKYYEI